MATNKIEKDLRYDLRVDEIKYFLGLTDRNMLERIQNFGTYLTLLRTTPFLMPLSVSASVATS